MRRSAGALSKSSAQTLWDKSASEMRGRLLSFVMEIKILWNFSFVNLHCSVIILNMQVQLPRKHT